VNPGAAGPFREDFFKDESKIEFFDIIALMDSPNSPAKDQALAAYAAAAAERTLRPLERHRLDGFYHDGPSLMDQMVSFRDSMALLQYQSDKPIRPMEVISKLFDSHGNPLPGGPSKQGRKTNP